MLGALAAGIAGCSSSPVVEEDGTPEVEAVAAPGSPETPGAAAQTRPVKPRAAPVPATARAATAPSESALSGAQQSNYVGYTGASWSKDYGVVRGRCNPAAAQAALGRAGGARAVAVFVPGEKAEKFPEAMDDADRACIGHALELTRKGTSAAWSNATSGIAYRLTMGHDSIEDSLPCREFVAAVSAKGGKNWQVKGVACRQEQARWDFRQRS